MKPPPHLFPAPGYPYIFPARMEDRADHGEGYHRFSREPAAIAGEGRDRGDDSQAPGLPRPHVQVLHRLLRYKRHQACRPPGARSYRVPPVHVRFRENEGVL